MSEPDRMDDLALFDCISEAQKLLTKAMLEIGLRHARDLSEPQSDENSPRQ